MVVSFYCFIFDLIKNLKAMNKPKIDGVIFLSLEISFYCQIDRNLYDVGSVNLECEGRNFVLDVCQSHTEENDLSVTITCKLEVDTETFPIGSEYNYQLLKTDLYSPNLKVSTYLGGEFEIAPEHMTLFVKVDETTKAIDVDQD